MSTGGMGGISHATGTTEKHIDVSEKTVRVKVTILGTGTSQGIPVIGCDCAVCRSDDPRDRRLRTSALIEWRGKTFCLDVGPDFRQQMLRAEVRRLDAILLTHEHNDHVIGLDDVRPFNFKQKRDMPVYGLPRVLDQVAHRFAYIFTEQPYPGAPRVRLLPLQPTDRPVEIEGLPVWPLEVRHGNLSILGFRFADFAYLTDVKELPPQTMAHLQGCRAIVLSALHRKLHHSHLKLEEALALLDRLQPQRAWLTHLSHRMGTHREVSALLPEGVALAYDGLVIEMDMP